VVLSHERLKIGRSNVIGPALSGSPFPTHAVGLDSCHEQIFPDPSDPAALRRAWSFEAYKRRELMDKEVHDLAIRFWDAGALGALEIPRLIKEWREPRHPEFVQMGKTAWHLLNSVTETIKGDLWRLPARTRAIHTILDKECGLERNGNGAPDEPLGIVEVTA